MSSAPDRWEALIAKAIPTFESRPQQSEMAEAVAKAFKERNHLLVEAGTGVGKSFAYLLPAIDRSLSHGERVIVATHTIALQEQIVEKDIPALKKAVPSEFKALLVKGRNNYIGLRRLMQTVRKSGEIFSDENRIDQVKAIEQWAYGTRDGSLSDLDFQPVADVWSHVRSESNNCMGSKCDYFDRCFYMKARRLTESAHVLIVNHALFFTDLMLRERGVTFLPDYDHVVFDEAHNIESVAGNHMGLSVANTQVQYLLRSIHNQKTGRGFLSMLDNAQLTRAVTNVEMSAGAFFNEIANLLAAPGSVRVEEPIAVENSVTPALAGLAHDLRSFSGKLQREDEKFEINSYADRCAELADHLKAVLDQELADCVYWVETSSGRDRRVTLKAAPLKIDEVLRRSLFERARSVVLTSATLSTGGGSGFAYLRDRLGIDEAEELELDSPYNFRECVTLHLETGLPEPNAPGFVEQAAQRIQHYLDQTDGRAFILFTSYSALNRTAELLQPFCAERDMTLLVQGRDLPRSRMIEVFKCTDRSVILGTDSFWQGVDVPGKALQNVIITKLPFAAPDRPLVEARMQMIEADGGNPFMEFQVPEAVLKLKQGFGRLIRGHDDSGIVVVLDKRMKTKRYGKRFLEALPSCRIETHE